MVDFHNGPANTSTGVAFFISDDILIVKFLLFLDANQFKLVNIK
jgi:hypothetical protein